MDDDVTGLKIDNSKTECIFYLFGIGGSFENPCTIVKGCYYDHFWIHPSNWSFWYQMKAPIFLIRPYEMNSKFPVSARVGMPPVSTNSLFFQISLLKDK